MAQRRSGVLIASVVLFICFCLSGCDFQTNSTPEDNSNPAFTPTRPPVTPQPALVSASQGEPGTFKCVAGALTLDGSTSMQPLVSQLAQDYQRKCPGAEITVNANGSSRGLTEVANNLMPIADTDVHAPANLSELVDHKIAVGIFTLVLNSSVTGVTNLTMAQIQDIYTGKITSWDRVGGPKQAIKLLCRSSTSGTRQAFEAYVLGGKKTKGCPKSDSTADLLAKHLQQTPGAIGYVTPSIALKQSLTMIQIDGHAATSDLVKQNVYQFWSVEHLYTQSQLPELAQAFIDYTFSEAAQKIVVSTGSISIQGFPPAILNTHK